MIDALLAGLLLMIPSAFLCSVIVIATPSQKQEYMDKGAIEAYKGNYVVKEIGPPPGSTEQVHYYVFHKVLTNGK